MEEEKIKKLREEARKLLAKNEFTFRSCWKCNLCHEYLKERGDFINCIECGHWFYKGEDISVS